jgi:hypothetical protein
MLLPRVRTEMVDVGAGNWARTFGLTDEGTKATGKEDKGQMAEVKELVYQTQNGEFKGFFKEDTGHLAGSKAAGRDLESGIRMADPNFGARALAMYRLDQLLGAGVTARVEFAVHDGKMGIVSETAQGTKAADVKWTAGSGGKGETSVDDAVLQRCLNRLQILDAIALQLDRHMGNYYVQTSKEGKVTGVTGIDLDMSFGRDYTDMSKNPKGWTAYSYRGLPDVFDEEFASRIMRVSDDQVRGALEGLLGKGEVEATVLRFQAVKAKIKEAEEAGQLKHEWKEEDAGTSAPGDVDDLMSGHGKNYAEMVRGTGVEATMTELMQDAKADILQEVGDVPPLTGSLYQDVFIGDPGSRFLMGRGALYGLVATAISGRTLTAAQAPEAILDVLRAVLDDQHLRAEFEVAIQEGTLQKSNIYEWQKRVGTLFTQQWPTVLVRYPPKQLVNN